MLNEFATEYTPIPFLYAATNTIISLLHVLIDIRNGTRCTFRSALNNGRSITSSQTTINGTVSSVITWNSCPGGFSCCVKLDSSDCWNFLGKSAGCTWKATRSWSVDWDTRNWSTIPGTRTENVGKIQRTGNNVICKYSLYQISRYPWSRIF